MKSAIAKTDYFKLGNMSMLCLLTLENGYEIVGIATKTMTDEQQEEEARGIAYQRALFKWVELESIPEFTPTGIHSSV